jgi:hypothetical protein
MFALLKGKLLLIWGGLTAILLATIKYLAIRNKKFKAEAKRARADLQFKEEVIELDAEIDQEFSHRAEEAKKDEKKVPRNLSDPNNF